MRTQTWVVVAALVLTVGCSGDKPTAATSDTTSPGTTALPETTVSPSTTALPETTLIPSTTAPPTTPAPTTTAPLADPRTMLLQELDLAAGWIPNPALSELDNGQPSIEPKECDLPPAPTVAKLQVGFDNNSAGARLTHVISVYADEAAAIAELQQDQDQATRCTKVLLDGVRLDITGPGDRLDGESSLSFQGTLTNMSTGQTMDVKMTEVCRGRIISIITLLGAPYAADTAFLTRTITTRLPPNNANPATIPIDTQP